RQTTAWSRRPSRCRAAGPPAVATDHGHRASCGWHPTPCHAKSTLQNCYSRSKKGRLPAALPLTSVARVERHSAARPALLAPGAQAAVALDAPTADGIAAAVVVGPFGPFHADLGKARGGAADDAQGSRRHRGCQQDLADTNFHVFLLDGSGSPPPRLPGRGPQTATPFKVWRIHGRRGAGQPPRLSRSRRR